MQKKSKNKENYQKITKRHYIKEKSFSKKLRENLNNKNSGITLLASIMYNNNSNNNISKYNNRNNFTETMEY